MQVVFAIGQRFEQKLTTGKRFLTTQKSVIVVAGMHRSGTSATGGVLQALGVHLPGRLLEGKPDNPKGFFENDRIVQFHEKLLQRLESAYDEPLALTDFELDRARSEGAVDDLTSILREETGDHALCAYKDPRICRILPLWSEAVSAVGADMLVVSPLRDPIEVAASLTHRNGFSQAHGLILWLNHALAAEYHSRGHRRSFFLYASLLDNWRSVTTKIARDLGIRYPKDRHKADAVIDDFLSTELRHHRGSNSHPQQGDLQHLVGQAWHAFAALCEDSFDETANATLDAIRERVTSTGAVFHEFVRSDRRSFDDLRMHATALAERRDELERHTAGLNAEMTRLAQANDSTQKTIAALDASNSAAEERSQALTAELNDAVSQLVALRAEHVIELDAQTSAAEERSQALTAELNDALSQFFSLRSEHELAGRKLHSVQRSLRLSVRNLDAARHELAFFRKAVQTNERDLASTIETAARLQLTVDEHRRSAKQARCTAESALSEANAARSEADAAWLEADAARLEAEDARLEAEDARLEAETMRAHAQAVEEHRTMLLRSNVWQIARLAAAIMRWVPAPARTLMKRALRPLLRPILPRNIEPPLRILAPIEQVDGLETNERVNEAPATPPAIVVPPVRAASDAELRLAAIIEDSDLFDVHIYRGTQEAGALGLSPALHYVLIGEAKGYCPSLDFNPNFYGAMYPDVEKAEINKLEHYITNGASEGRRPLYVIEKFDLPKFEPDVLGLATHPVAGLFDRAAKDAEIRTAAIIEDSVFFDPQVYEGTHEAEALGLSPALHYVLIGEAKGYSPSPKFDPHFYGLMYRDIEEAGINKLEHYITNGAVEGRRPLYPADKLYLPKFEPDARKPTALVIAHEASRTGAPILAWNIVHHLKATHNVLTLLLGPGDLTANFVEVSDGVIGPLATEVGHNPIEAKYIVWRILEEYAIDFVIANSIETRIFAVEFARRMVPLVVLSHEFASYTRPVGALEDIFSVADEIIFSAGLVRRQSEMDYPILAVRDVHVIPQGQSIVPLTSNLDDEELEATPHDEDLRPADAPDTFLVIGLGTVQHRKGVDLFISAAATAMRARPDLNFRFVWYGHGYRPDIDVQYSAYLKAQIEILGLSGRLEIRDPIMDLSPVYRQANALFLSSRLDPLPNVAIDAAMAGIPVVCFEGASGFADILASDPATAELVVPHLDSTAAGHLLADLAGDRSRWLNLRQAIGNLGERTFRMEEYVATLAALGERAAERNRLKKIDREFLRDSNVFEPNFYKGFSLTHMSDDDALTHYVTHASRVGALSNPDIDLQARSPLPGFHPLSFAREGLNYQRTLERDPLAEFLRMGSPNGPWIHPVITATGARPTPFRSQLTAVHGHFHYPELVPEFLSALSKNQLECDLFFSVTQPAAVEAVKAATDRYDRGDVQVRVVPNLGRDIGPFLTEFASELSAYEIIGHFHGKRSVHLEDRAKDHGTRWRNFLWQHLLGGEHEMADIIVDRMMGDPKLGLVFAEDTYLLGWTENRRIAEQLTGRLGLASHLPDFFSFPMGTMFWARQEALQPLFDLDLTWNDYPAEPLANDGTILHAIERLIPHVVAKQGFSTATTHLPGVKR